MINHVYNEEIKRQLINRLISLYDTESNYRRL